MHQVFVIDARNAYSPMRALALRVLVTILLIGEGVCSEIVGMLPKVFGKEFQFGAIGVAAHERIRIDVAFLVE